MESPREIREHGCGFVIGMGGDVQDARGDAGIFDRFHGFWQTGASAWGWRELRFRFDSEKRAHEQSECEPRAVPEDGRCFEEYCLCHVSGRGTAEQPH